MDLTLNDHFNNLIAHSASGNFSPGVEAHVKRVFAVGAYALFVFMKTAPAPAKEAAMGVDIDVFKHHVTPFVRGALGKVMPSVVDDGLMLDVAVGGATCFALVMKMGDTEAFTASIAQINDALPNAITQQPKETQDG